MKPGENSSKFRLSEGTNPLNAEAVNRTLKSFQLEVLLNSIDKYIVPSTPIGRSIKICSRYARNYENEFKVHNSIWRQLKEWLSINNTYNITFLQETSRPVSQSEKQQFFLSVVQYYCSSHILSRCPTGAIITQILLSCFQFNCMSYNVFGLIACPTIWNWDMVPYASFYLEQTSSNLCQNHRLLHCT